MIWQLLYHADYEQTFVGYWKRCCETNSPQSSFEREKTPFYVRCPSLITTLGKFVLHIWLVCVLRCWIFKIVTISYTATYVGTVKCEILINRKMLGRPTVPRFIEHLNAIRLPAKAIDLSRLPNWFAWKMEK